ncbi:MAG: hypothetical protein ACOYM2_18865, partial [Rectinemataceae bacterium]
MKPRHSRSRQGADETRAEKPVDTGPRLPFPDQPQPLGGEPEGGDGAGLGQDGLGQDGPGQDGRSSRRRRRRHKRQDGAGELFPGTEAQAPSDEGLPASPAHPAALASDPSQAGEKRPDGQNRGRGGRGGARQAGNQGQQGKQSQQGGLPPRQGEPPHEDQGGQGSSQGGPPGPGGPGAQGRRQGRPPHPADRQGRERQFADRPQGERGRRPQQEGNRPQSDPLSYGPPRSSGYPQDGQRPPRDGQGYRDRPSHDRPSHDRPSQARRQGDGRGRPPRPEHADYPPRPQGPDTRAPLFGANSDDIELPPGISGFDADGRPIFSRQKTPSRKAASPVRRLESLAPSAQCLALLHRLDEAVDEASPLQARHRAALRVDIRKLWEDLTSDREYRPADYLGSPGALSAYIRYFLPWNVYRLVSILSNADFCLPDRAVIVDIGSGPLTFVISLWIARPELREVPMTIHCIDRVE